jgi:hypothetical protein
MLTLKHSVRLVSEVLVKVGVSLEAVLESVKLEVDVRVAVVFVHVERVEVAVSLVVVFKAQMPHEVSQ